MRVLFPSDSCFPMSPSHEETDSISSNDQMQLIVRYLGPFSSLDTAFISNEDAKLYVIRLEEANYNN